MSAGALQPPAALCILILVGPIVAVVFLLFFSGAYSSVAIAYCILAIRF